MSPVRVRPGAFDIFWIRVVRRAMDHLLYNICNKDICVFQHINLLDFSIYCYLSSFFVSVKMLLFHIVGLTPDEMLNLNDLSVDTAL